MSVKWGLLALLATEPMYGAQLRAEFERRTGGTWPLNVGQVYTTLGRLERDGLVTSAGAPDEEGRIPYGLTAAGQDAVRRWWASPVDRESTPRDELVIKLALAVTVPGVDVPTLILRQRTATLRHLQDLTRLKRQAAAGQTDSTDLAWRLVLENLVYADEAEIRWLDHVEATVTAAARQRSAAAAADAPTSAPASASASASAAATAPPPAATPPAVPARGKAAGHGPAGDDREGRR